MGMLVKLFKALSANQYPGQIALSFVLGMILGLTPLLFVHNLLTIALIFFLRVNIPGVVVAWIFFSGVAYLLDPVFNQIGLWVLHLDMLQPLFTAWYNEAFWRLLHFNNSIVMGSILTAYLLAIPAFFIFLVLIKKYRATFLVWINKFKVVQMFKAVNLTEKGGF